jgi:WhiB family redox-sensing transcriptional regulator
VTINAAVALDNWPDQAACKGRAQSIFFPIGAGSQSDLARRPAGFDRYATARAICATCPVIDQCRRYALSVVASGQQLDGCWAGLDERERRELAGRKVGWAS